MAEFVVNNKIYSAIRIYSFMVNYRRELRIEANIRKNRKMEKIIEFAKRIKKIQEEARVVLRKAQEKIK